MSAQATEPHNFYPAMRMWMDRAKAAESILGAISIIISISEDALTADGDRPLGATAQRKIEWIKVALEGSQFLTP